MSDENLRGHEDPANTIRMAKLEVTIVAPTDEIVVDNSIADELADAWYADHPGTIYRARGKEKILWGKPDG